MAWLVRYRMLLLLPLFLTTAAALAQSRVLQQLVEPEDRAVSVNGTIRLIHAYGPPGYGEYPKHDAHVTYWALETPIPVNTLCVPEKPEFAGDCSCAKRMNLFFKGLALTPLGKLPAAKWKDKPVVVYGKIHRADTAGQMTALYMDVSGIAPARQTPKH